ncbi:hypothetical protein HD554DRAFT_2309935 [Boletus coccyginus]|nr:hypothetical protein HD554DRAFT_2309935 [Boletus coccyginus]
MAVLDATMGAYLIGVVIASVLYGCTCVQTWYYYTHYPSDPWYIKLLVFAVFVSDTGHQALISNLVYTYLVTYFGDWEQLNNVVLSLVIEVFFNGFTALVVQCFLAMRVFRLSNKNWFAFGSVVSLVSFGTHDLIFLTVPPQMALVILEWILILIFSIKAISLKTYQQFATINAISMSINAAAAAGDVLITIFLCYLLQKSRTGFRRSDMTINKLIMFSINTGLLTSLDALASLFCISVWPHTFIYIAFYFNIGRLYCNSLLATLNARKGLRGSDSRHDELSLSQTTQQKVNHSFLGTASQRAPNNISIKIDTTQEYIRDEYSSSTGELKHPEVI